MPSVSKAVCLQRPSTSGGRRNGEAARSVAAPRARQEKPKVIRSGSGSARGQHCSPVRAVAAPIPTTKKVLSKLRLVNLAAMSEECDLTWTMFVLQGAPSIEELCIRVCDCLGIWDEEERKKHAYSEERKDADAKWEAYGFKHRKLSVLRIFGFQSEVKFVDYITTVMEAAVNLKDIYPYEKPACKDECEYSRQREA